MQDKLLQMAENVLFVKMEHLLKQGILVSPAVLESTAHWEFHVKVVFWVNILIATILGASIVHLVKQLHLMVNTAKMTALYVQRVKVHQVPHVLFVTLASILE